MNEHVQIPDVEGVDLGFTPRSYFTERDLGLAIPSDIMGRARRDLARSLSADPSAAVDDLPPELLTPGEQPEPVGASAGLADLVGRPMAELEGLFIAETLKSTGGNREEAAQMLGIGERTLYRKIKEYGLH